MKCFTPSYPFEVVFLFLLHPVCSFQRCEEGDEESGCIVHNPQPKETDSGMHSSNQKLVLRSGQAPARH
jgi:hypothetical protein